MHNWLQKKCSKRRGIKPKLGAQCSFGLLIGRRARGAKRLARPSPELATLWTKQIQGLATIAAYSLPHLAWHPHRDESSTDLIDPVSLSYSFTCSELQQTYVACCLTPAELGRSARWEKTHGQCYVRVAVSSPGTFKHEALLQNDE